MIFYWCRETRRCEGRSGTEGREDLRKGEKKLKWSEGSHAGEKGGIWKR